MSFINNFKEGAKLISDQMKSKEFWSKFIKVAIPFFILITIVSLLMNSSKDLFSGNFEAVNQQNFANGQWKSFFSFKIVFSFLYGLWVTSKHIK